MIPKNELMNIFLADDDQDDRSIFKIAFEQTNLHSTLTMFKNGVELMNHLNNSDAIVPHILFLDLNMPGKTGAQCLAEIRACARFRNMSIAIYSTSNSDKDIEDTLSGGANIYIHKPNDFERLKQIIKHILKINWQYQTSGLNRESFFLSI